MAAANLDWFYHPTGGVTHTDFFALGRQITRKLVKERTLKIFGNLNLTEEEIYKDLNEGTETK